LNPLVTLAPAISAKSSRAWFTAKEIAQVYQIPTANPSTNVVVGVVSFGGGLYGNVDANGVLTDGDVQAYWLSIGIPANAMPKVIVVPINGAKNQPSMSNADGGATMENTIDIETLGGCCPSANLTIILYISPNSLSQVYNIFQYILLNPVNVNGVSYKPSILSVSWGAPEIYFSNTLLTNINNLLQSAASQGINICTASGDYGSNNGVGGSGSYTDFPSSCPYVTAVGGTTLVCPSLVYANNTTSETAWSSGGGAVSSAFPRPIYQTIKCPNATGRSVPDIALNSNPNTGIGYTVNGSIYVVGGTSIAAPTMAGFLAAVNAKQFVNPILYTADSSSFNDIVSGSNGAFSCKVDYDNCTGLGSLNCSALAPFVVPTAPTGPTAPSAPNTIPVTGITLNTNTVTVHPSQAFQLLATVVPTNATNKTITWSRDNTNVSVSSHGAVSGLSLGSSTVTASSVNGITASATVSITQAVNSVNLNVTRFNMRIGQVFRLIATVLPANAANKSVTWKSENSSIVKVAADGTLTALRLGTTVITVTSDDMARRATAIIIVFR